jgi:hypothetical protein
MGRKTFHREGWGKLQVGSAHYTGGWQLLWSAVGLDLEAYGEQPGSLRVAVWRVG